MHVSGSSLMIGVQARLCDLMLRAFVVTTLPLLALSLLRVFEYGWMPIMGVHILIVGALAGAYAVRQRLTTEFKASLLIGSLVTVAIMTMARNHDQIYATPFTLIAILVTMTLFQVRAAALVMLATVSLQLGYVYHETGTISTQELLLTMASPLMGTVVVFILNEFRSLLAGLVEQLQAQNAELERARAEASEASQAKSSFLASVSHDLRTPMNGILGAVTLIQARQAGLDAEQRQHVSVIGASARALLELLNELLDLSRIEAGRLKLELVPVDLRALLEEVYGLMVILADQKQLGLNVVCPSDLPRVITDPARLRQILQNLVGNAVKFTDQGQISVAVEQVSRDGDQIGLRFTVRDTGIGVAEHQWPRLFERFEQADPSISRRFGGTGLGLAICRRLVELLDGEIGVEGAPGQGTAFWFTLGCVVAPAEAAPRGVTRLAAPPEAQPTRPASPDSRRLLVADDSELNQVVLVGLLKLLGQDRVVCVGDGEAALARLSQEPFDLVLMDVQMPLLDGLEATRRVRRGEAGLADRALPIIAVTASAHERDAARCLEAGMSDLLIKPIALDALAATLARWLPAQEPR